MWFYLQEIPRHIQRQKVQGWGMGAGGQCLTGAEFQFGKMKEVLETAGGGGYTTM